MKKLSILILIFSVFLSSVAIAEVCGLRCRLDQIVQGCQKSAETKDNECDFYLAFDRMLKPPAGSTAVLPCDKAEVDKVMLLLKQSGVQVLNAKPKNGDACADESYVYEDGILHTCSAYDAGMPLTIYRSDFSNEKAIEYAFIKDDELVAIYKLDQRRLVKIPYDDMIMASLIPGEDMSNFYYTVSDPFAFTKNGNTYVRFTSTPIGHTNFDKQILGICTYLWQKDKFSLAGPNYNLSSADGRLVPSLNCKGQKNINSLTISTKDCKSEKNTAAKTECFEKLSVIADVDLNNIYRLLKDSLTQEKKHQLILEERKWIEYRNQKCNKKEPTELSCNFNMTQSRAKELRAYLAWIQTHTTASSNQKPRRTDFNDCGYRKTYPREGWYDAQGQGVSNDYCRYVGDAPKYTGARSPKNWFSCALAGEHTDYSDRNKYTETSPWLNTFQPLLPGDKCYTD